MRKLTGLLLLAPLALLGCGGSSSSVSTGGGGGGGSIVTYGIPDQIGYVFDPASKVGVCTTGLSVFALNSIQLRATPGASLTALPGGSGATTHADFRNGRVVGTSSTIAGGAVTGSTGRFWSSITAVSVALRTSGAFPVCRTSSINNAGAIVGLGRANVSAGDVPIYWSTSTSNPVALPGTGTPTITDSGYILYTNGNQVSISPNSVTAPVNLAVPAGFTGLGGPVRGTTGDVYVMAFQGSSLFSATTVRPYRLDLATRVLTAVPTVASGSFSLSTAVNGYLGGTDVANNRPILVRNSTVSYVDDLVPEGTGEEFTKVVAIFTDGSLILEGNKNGSKSHFYVPPGRISFP